MVEVIGFDVPLVAVKVPTLPVPFAPSPIAVFELDHANVAPTGLLTKLVIGILSPLQTTVLLGTVTVGFEPTVTVEV